jgi:hypothetical protein
MKGIYVSERSGKGPTFLFFVKKQGKTFRVFVKKCIIGESKHCAGGLSWNHSIIPK